MNSVLPTRCDLLAVLLVAGPDARNFLQGQVTADVQTLKPNRVLLAACNSAQGRVQAVLWIIERDEGIALVVNRELLASTATRLQRYVLRSKVTIDSQRLDVGVAPISQNATATTQTGSHHQDGEPSYVYLPGHRQALVIGPAGAIGTSHETDSLSFRSDHVRAGLPEIFRATHEQFVAQMLNLDLLGGISFEKGCYTGQEVIARTHYRGAIKRRMFRYRAICPPPPPGTRILAGGEHAGDVADAVATAEGCEILGVISLAQRNAKLKLESGAALEELSLPYVVTEGQ